MAPRLTKTLTTPTLIATFHIFPKDLFRITTTLPFRIRARRTKPAQGTVYDLITKYGMVKPKALSPKNYECRSPNHREVIIKVIILIADPPDSGTNTPRDLILVQDTKSHYSLQVSKPMSVPDFEAKINEFMTTEAKSTTKAQWLEEYPRSSAEAESISRRPSEAEEDMTSDTSSPRLNKIANRERVIHNPTPKFQTQSVSRRLNLDGEEMKLSLDTPRPRKVDGRKRVIHNLGKFQVIKEGSLGQEHWRNCVARARSKRRRATETEYVVQEGSCSVPGSREG
ncbi:MAG: hypothetical protein Q9221_001084 [Calogaya cf. arnoldii]